MGFKFNPLEFTGLDVSGTSGGGGTPTGSANTVAFFDSGGTLNSDSTIVLDSSIKKIALLTGSNTIGTNAVTRGVAFLDSSTLGTNAGTDSFLNLQSSTVAVDSASRSFIRGNTLTINGASGLGGAVNSIFVGSNATIGQNTSSIVGGFYGNIANTTNIAANSSNILMLTGIFNATQTTRVSLTASTVGALIVGFSNLDGQILAFGAGSETRGFSTGSGSIIRTLGGQGSSSVGSVAAGGLLSAGAFAAAHARGFASGTSSTIQATNTAAQAFGSALGAGSITSNGIGSLGHGRVESSGQINSSSSGTLAQGYALNSGYIEATNHGAFASGAADGSNISASGEGSLAHGQSINAGSISASSNGAVAFGISDVNAISASGSAAQASGNSTTGAIVASGYVSSSRGDDITTDADFGLSNGQGLLNHSLHATLLGRFALETPANPNSWVDTDPLLALGNGADSSNRSNAFTVAKDGRIDHYGAVVNKKARIITGNDTVSARTDQLVIADLTSVGSFTVDLPNAEDGLELSFTTAGDGTAQYVITPFAGDSLDVAVNNVLVAPVTLVAIGNVWYAKANETNLNHVSSTLTANTVVATDITQLTNPVNRINSNGLIINYSMLSDNGDVRSGNLYVAFNKTASTAVVNDVYAETAALSATLDAIVSGGLLKIQYTNPDATNNVSLITNVKFN